MKGILLKCPKGHTREVGVEFAGRAAVCDECGHVWNVPSGDPPEQDDEAQASEFPRPRKWRKLALSRRDELHLHRARERAAARAERAGADSPGRGSFRSGVGLGAGFVVGVVGLVLVSCLVLAVIGNVMQPSPIGTARIKDVLSKGSVRDTTNLWFRPDRTIVNGRAGFIVRAGQRVQIYEMWGPKDEYQMLRVKTDSGEEGWIARLQLEDFR